MDNSIRKTVEKSAISVDKVYTSNFQKEGTQSAQLRQVITTTAYYPSKQIESNMQDNPFSMSDFNFQEDDYVTSENRVAFIDVPPGVSADDVLAKLPLDSCIYRVLSNYPIITSNQQYAIDTMPNVSLDQFANSQVVRYPKNHAKAGQLVKDSYNKVQYRALFYSNVPKEDQDNRNSNPEEFYASPEIKAELTNNATIITGQEVF